MGELALQLSPKQAAWLRYMLRDERMDEVEAYRRAFGDESDLRVSQGIELLMGNPMIREVVEAERQARVDAEQVTRSRLIVEMAKIAFSDRAIKVSDKITALKELGKFIGVTEGDRDKGSENITYVFNMPPAQVSESEILEIPPAEEEVDSKDPEKFDWDD